MHIEFEHPVVISKYKIPILSSSILQFWRTTGMVQGPFIFNSDRNTQLQNAILNDIHYSAKQLDPIDSTKKGDRERKKKRQKKAKKANQENENVRSSNISVCRGCPQLLKTPASLF